MRANVQAALRSLGENWQRAVLSGLGVTVASIAILLLISIGLGVQKDISSQVDDLGVNVLVVVPGHVGFGGGFNPNLGGQSWFRESHAAALRTVPGVERVGMLTFAGGGVRYKSQDAYPMVIACTPEWFEIHRVELAAGKVFGPEEGPAKVVVLGETAKEILFGKGDALGKSVEINGGSYKVVGVTKEKLSGQSMFAGQGFQNVAYIPFATQKAVSASMQIDRLVMKSAPNVEPKQLVGALEKELGKTLDRQQFSVLTQEDLLRLIYQVIGILGTLVVGLTSIGLFIGGVGVMTVMLMSVNERRKEIGVRKAVGAKRSDIFWQFLSESALIGLGGVLVGLAVSVVVCLLLAKYSNIKPLMTPVTVGLTFGVGLGLGSLFGLLPAVRAAKQDPVVCLRME